MWPDMFYSHKRPLGGGGKITPPGISQLPYEIEPTFHRLPPIFDNGHSTVTNGNTARLNRKYRKWKIKIYIYKLVVSIYRLADEIEGQFQWQILCFRSLVNLKKVVII